MWGLSAFCCHVWSEEKRVFGFLDGRFDRRSLTRGIFLTLKIRQQGKGKKKSMSLFCLHKTFFDYLIFSCCFPLCCHLLLKHTSHHHDKTINPHRERPDSPITTPPLAKSKQTLTLSKCGLIAFNINRPCKTLGRRTAVAKEACRGEGGCSWTSPCSVIHSRHVL